MPFKQPAHGLQIEQGNCPPTPPLTQQLSIDIKLSLMLG